MSTMESQSRTSPPRLDIAALTQLLDRDESTAASIAQAIEPYPDFAAELLRQANSIQLALQRHVRSVERAINVLGRQRILETADRYLRHDAATRVTAPHFPKPASQPTPAEPTRL